MRSRRGGVFAFLFVLSLVAGPASASAADRIYGVTAKNRLVTLHSDSPGVFRANKSIRGLARGETILAIDFRPATGALYGLSSGGRLYAIAVKSGRATPAGGPFDPTLGGGDAGFDFNPVADKIRLVTEPGRNVRLDPVSGRIVDSDPATPGIQEDGRLAYAPGDPAGSAAPRLAASAYTNSRTGATATRLFGIDAARDTLVFQEPPNEGVLSTVGRLGVDTGGRAGFDIARNGRAYASFVVRGSDPVGLFRIDLDSGRATPAAEFNAVGAFARRTVAGIRALAVAGSVRNDKRAPRVSNRKLNNPLVSELLSGRVLRLAAGCSEACVVRAQLLLGQRVVGDATGGVRARGGRTVLDLRLSRSGRRVVRRLRPGVLTVAIGAADAAGNVIRTRNFRGR